MFEYSVSFDAQFFSSFWVMQCWSIWPKVLLLTCDEKGIQGACEKRLNDLARPSIVTCIIGSNCP